MGGKKKYRRRAIIQASACPDSANRKKKKISRPCQVPGSPSRHVALLDYLKDNPNAASISALTLSFSLPTLRSVGAGGRRGGSPLAFSLPSSSSGYYGSSSIGLGVRLRRQEEIALGTAAFQLRASPSSLSFSSLPRRQNSGQLGQLLSLRPASACV